MSFNPPEKKRVWNNETRTWTEAPTEVPSLSESEDVPITDAETLIRTYEEVVTEDKPDVEALIEKMKEAEKSLDPEEKQILADAGEELKRHYNREAAAEDGFVRYDLEPDDDGNVVTIKLPRPIGWKLLVRPRQAKKMSSGGIVLATETSESEEAMTFIGQVIAIGEAAFKATTQGGIEMDQFMTVPQLGDWVVYAPFAGQKMRVRGDDSIFLLLNDTEIQGLVDNPEDYWSWIDA